MKKTLKRILGLCVSVILLSTSILCPVGLAASDVYELTFDNLFIFEQWANHANFKVLASDGSTTSTITPDISNGSFVLTNNASDEVFTNFSMSSVGAFYSMPVEANTEYVFSYIANGTTTSFETFVFYFDEAGQYTSLESKFAYQYGLNEWSFTTPEGTGYIQVRFDNNTPSSNVTVSDIKIRSKAVYDYAKDNTYRKTFTYTAGATYGALPVPSRDNLVFAGWFTGPDGTGEKITADTTVAPESKALFSKWDPIVAGDLSVVSLPVKQTYCVGEKLNTRGLVIGVTYPDGTSENIDEGFACSPEYLTSTGTQTITVTYGNSSTSFDVNVKASDNKTISINGTQKTVAFANNVYTVNYSGSAFNRYVIKYTSDAYVKGILNFNGTNEEFFLEPSENGEFSGYIDGFISGTTQTAITDITFTPLDKSNMDFTLLSIDLSKGTNPGDSSGMVYLSDSNYKIGIDLDWGGALTYLEDTANSIVSAKSNQDTSLPSQVGFSSKYEGTFTSGGINIGSVTIGGTTKNKYETASNVNLINAHDTGRLVQQSYYGTGSYPYEPGMYGEAVWNYNPVQGGNLYNEASKIVDINVSANEIYIKCRPLDWAKEAVDITPSYMEAWYTLEDGMMRATCRFVDFSGYPSVTTTQELPAFYCVEPLNDFVYYSGGEPWSDSNTKVNRADLGFWGTATDQDFICNENWAAFKGDDDDSFAIGIYCPGQTLFHTGVYYGGDGVTRCSTLDPATEDPTSYMGIVDTLHFQSYQPISYCYYIKTGDVDTIRSSFKTVAQVEADICNATSTNGFCDMCGKYVAPELTEDKYDLNGDGSSDSVYEISNAGELIWFKDFVNSGNAAANAVVTNDIVLNNSFIDETGTPDTASISHTWTPIGSQALSYNGIFCGQGHTISGLYLNDSTAQYAGLFGNTGSSAIICEVGVTDSYINANSFAGGICGNNGGTIINCYCIRSVINASTNVSGIAGAGTGSIATCYSTASVYGSTYAGGICGNNSGTLSNCYYLESSAINASGVLQSGTGTSSDSSATDVETQTTAKALDEFYSGEVAYLLQKFNSTQIWGQKSNEPNSAPIFDYTGEYKVTAIGSEDNYSVAFVGDITDDGSVNITDYQQLANLAVSEEAIAESYVSLFRSDLNGDGYIDVLDCSHMALMINGLRSGVDVYHVGDFDCDGIAYTQADIAAIKKGLINQHTLSTREKYLCDLNIDGVLDVNDRDILTEQEEFASEPIFINATEAIAMKNKTANVIILCGQSNAYGASPLTNEVRATVGDTDFSNIKIKYNNINSDDGTNNWRTHYSNNEFETFRLGIGGQADAWFGPEVGISYHLATTEATKDEMWYIIKYTAAGTFLGGNWIYDAGYQNAVNSQNVYDGIGGYLSDTMIDYVDTALDEIANIHSADKINIRAFMWHQGESDSCFEAWANQYGDLQNMLVSKVRTAFESRDADAHIGFVDGGIAAYDSRTFDNPLTGANQTYNSWVYSDTVNTYKSNMANLWYVPANTDKNIINTTTAGLYQNSTSSTKLADSIWVDTSTCKSKYVNNNENGEYDGAHYCGESMFYLGIWYAQGMLVI